MRKRLMALLLGAAVCACAGPAEPDRLPTVAVAVSPSGASVSGVGATARFTATARDRDSVPVTDAVLAWSSLNPAIATVDAISGEVTAVSSGQVTIAATVDKAVGYALLTVSVPGVAPVRSFVLDTVPAPPSLQIAGGALWGSSPSNIFAVGPGTPLRFDGDRWSPFVGTVFFLSGVWGTSADDIYAVGGNAYHHFNGTAWSAEMQFPAYDVWGSSPRDVYTVGSLGLDRHGIVNHYDGMKWTLMEFPGWPELHAVWGFAADDVWAAGYGGLVAHFDGKQWRRILVNVLGVSGSAFTGIWGTSGQDVYIVGLPGTILHFNGLTWTSVPSGTTHGIWGICGTASDNIYLTSQVEVRHFDGNIWTSLPIPTGQYLHDVWCPSTGEAYVVGMHVRIFKGVR